MSEPASAASPPLLERAGELARLWADAAAAAPADHELLAGLVADDAGRRFVLEITERVMGAEALGVAAGRLRAAAPSAPDSLPRMVRGALRVSGGVAPILPAPTVPIARRVLREVLAPLVVDGRPRRIGEGLASLGAVAAGVQPNVCVLGEPVRGETAALQRLARVRDLVRRDDVDRIALTVREVLRPAGEWAFDQQVEEGVARLAPVFAAAAADGTMITLDVTCRADLDLTVAVFTRLLEDRGNAALTAALTLPTALPDAVPALQELSAWAQDRVDHGGGPITVRLSTAAPDPAERADAVVRGWTTVGHESRADADAAVLRCLDEALRPSRTRAVRLGVSGADLGIAAYAWLLAEERGVADALDLEMPHDADVRRVRAVAETTGAVLLRVAVADPADADSAIGQWVRVLLTHAGSAGADADGRLRAAGSRSTASTLRLGTRRTQNRLAPIHESVRASAPPPAVEEQLTQAVLGIDRGSGEQGFLETAVYSVREIDSDAGGAPGFVNAEGTDPSLQANREWARGVFARIRAIEAAIEADADGGGDGDGDGEVEAEIEADAEVEVEVEADAGAESEPGIDAEGHAALLARAREAGAHWGARPASERADILQRAAAALDSRRGELIALAAAESGLLLAEGDAEVDRAVDAARYYAITARELDAVAGAAFVPAALTAVRTSWRAPLAETADAALSVLAAGSAVILFPASQARRTATAVVEALWQAGVPRHALVVAAADADPVAVAHEGVDRIVLTGDPADAGGIRSHSPGLALAAEAGGRNAVIVTPSADLGQAAADVVRSAFVRGGQAATAVSIVILVGSAGRSRRFVRQLADAARSLRTGMPSDPAAQVGPLIARATGGAELALTELGDDEEWLVRPHLVAADPSGRLWSPGIRVGARPESVELPDNPAAPVLWALHVPTLPAAIEVSNRLATGPVAGLHSHDPEELRLWLDRIETGLLVVGGDTAGTAVQRRPAGGASALGRSGGPHRLIGLGSWRAQRSAALSSTLHLRGLDSRITAIIEAAQSSLDYEEFEGLRRAALSDALAWDREFGRVREVAGLGVERNLRRYRPVPAEVRACTGARQQDLLRVVIAAVRTGSPFVLSLAEGLAPAVRQSLSDLQIEIHLERDDEWLERGLRRGDVEVTDAAVRARRVRLVGSADAVRVARRDLLASPGVDADVVVVDHEVTSAGRIELLAFVREQMVSITAHRHGEPDPWSADVI